MKKESIVLHAMYVQKHNGKYYLPYTQWVYLREIVKYYNKVCLLSPTNTIDEIENDSVVDLKDFNNIEIYELPHTPKYIQAVKFFFHYVKAYKSLSNYDEIYVRYPMPFGWLQKFFFKKKDRIIHFVGDPIDVTKSNPNFSKLKKMSLLSMFYPEHRLYMWACKGASNFTNGYHIAEKLKSYGINARPLISSTLNEEDFFENENKIIDVNEPKIIYVGYLRKAKGIETIILAFQKLLKSYPKAQLSIVGSGEFETKLNNLVFEEKIDNVKFLGHIDDRKKLNGILRKHDIFAFGSLSEGSPRVILEAMANDLAVVSTPVGSLPNVFKDKEQILFADFNNPDMFAEKIEDLIKNPNLFKGIRRNAAVLIRNFTVQNFINKIFGEKDEK